MLYLPLPQTHTYTYISQQQGSFELQSPKSMHEDKTKNKKTKKLMHRLQRKLCRKLHTSSRKAPSENSSSPVLPPPRLPFPPHLLLPEPSAFTPQMQDSASKLHPPQQKPSAPEWTSRLPSPSPGVQLRIEWQAEAGVETAVLLALGRSSANYLHGRGTCDLWASPGAGRGGPWTAGGWRCRVHPVFF